ncbi:DUF2290 domain-containing protein [Salmonella enterica]|nr:DUF2290 domain-containing protein [Salmonella enterica]
MIIRPEVMVGHLNKLCFEWDKAGLTLGSNRSCVRQMKGGKVLISWDSENIVFKDNEFSSLAEYITLLSCSQYTLVLFDGSLLQLSYTLDRNEVIGHRLCWYPSPIDVSGIEDIDDIIMRLQTLLVESCDVLEEHITNPNASYPINLKGIFNRSPLRFDFSVMPDEQKDAHPDVHLHISHEDCRIPVKTPLCIRMFMRFIVENFYSNIPVEGVLVNGLPTWDNNEMLTQHHKGKIHFNYNR